MRGASRAALTQAKERLSAALAPGAGAAPGVGAGSQTAALVGGELFGVAHLLDREHGLRRALSDPAKRAEDKVALVTALLDGQVGPVTLELTAAAVRYRWSAPGDLADALEQLAVAAVVIGAEADGRLDDLEDELFRFGRVVAGAPELRAALTDVQLPADRKRDLLAALLAGKVSEATMQLITEAVLQPRGRSLEASLEQYAGLAAERRERLIAVVHTARALTASQRARLAAALAAAYGHEVHLAVVIDPGVLGGLSVRVHGEVIDGTVASRLEAVKRRLAS